MTEIKRKPVISATEPLEPNQLIESHQEQTSLPLSSTNEESDEEEESRGDSSREKGPQGGNTSSGNRNG